MGISNGSSSPNLSKYEHGIWGCHHPNHYWVESDLHWMQDNSPRLEGLVSYRTFPFCSESWLIFNPTMGSCTSLAQSLVCRLECDKMLHRVFCTTSMFTEGKIVFYCWCIFCYKNYEICKHNVIVLLELLLSTSHLKSVMFIRWLVWCCFQTFPIWCALELHDNPMWHLAC